MKEVIVYGGAFNPPTVAHQAIAQAAADYAVERDMELWLLPSGERYDKKIGVSVEKRLSYAHALLASLSTTATTQVCDVELKNTEMSQTFLTYERLAEDNPQATFTWIFGSDSVNTMHEWERGDWLRENLPLLVVERPGYELQDHGNNIQILEVDQLTTSSTEVRTRHEQGLSVAELVPPSVLPLL